MQILCKILQFLKGLLTILFFFKVLWELDRPLWPALPQNWLSAQWLASYLTAWLGLAGTPS
jgi:hypothetical protein